MKGSKGIQSQNPNPHHWRWRGDQGGNQKAKSVTYWKNMKFLIMFWWCAMPHYENNVTPRTKDVVLAPPQPTRDDEEPIVQWAQRITWRLKGGSSKVEGKTTRKMGEENLTLQGGNTPSEKGKIEEGWERKQTPSKK